MKLGLIRHAVTDWNTAGKLQGQLDVPLNDEGRMQVKRLAERFNGDMWDAVFSSDLQRARETAEAVAEVLDLPVITDQRLREYHLGSLEGTTLQDRLDRWGENWETADHGMESDVSVIARIQSFIQELEQRYPNKRLLIVSHGMTIGQIIRHLLAMEEKVAVRNTSVSIVEKKQGGWSRMLLDCTVHLEEKQNVLASISSKQKTERR